MSISIKDRHLSTSLYRKPMDNLHFSSFHLSHIKEAVPYRQALCIHRICSDKEESDGHLKMLKDALIRTGYNAQHINRQFRHATVKNCNVLLRKQTQNMTNKVSVIVRYFLGEAKLRFQHVIDDNEYLFKIIPTLPLLTFKQPPNPKQTIAHSKLPSLQNNSDHKTTQPCHGNLCKTCQVIEMDTIITNS
eukprot:g31604.t1